MQRVLEHTQLIGKLIQNNIMLDLIKKYNTQDLINCCRKIESTNIEKDLYSKDIMIQNEFIMDNEFISYFSELNKKNIDINRIKDFIYNFQINNKKISDFKLEKILEILENKKISSNITYDYLVYFSENLTSNEEQDIVANNLSYFYTQDRIKISDLTEHERNLFFESFMSDRNLIPILEIKKVCEILVQDKELKELILFLYSNNLSVPLNLKNYELIHNNSIQIYEFIQKIIPLIDHENMYQLLLRWEENGCTVYDLKILERKLQTVEKEQVEKIFYNKSSYINFIFGNKLNNFPLEYITDKREEILIYAIRNNKKNFLKLIQENSDIFLDISEKSLLYNEDFYNRYVNLNTLTVKNLQELINLYTFGPNLYLLNNGNYTFEEIKLLCELPSKYIILYNELSGLRIDEKMLIIKQLSKKNLLYHNIEDEDIQSLAKMLKEKHLYRWIEKDFSNIKNISPQNAIKVLINYEKIKKYLPQIKDETELLYIIRNIDEIQQYDSLYDIKKSLENIDIYWKELISIMKFDTQFIEDNKNNIKIFLLKNGAELALNYCQTCHYIDLKNFKKILKAELMGQFKTLKYYTNDLKKEIEFNLTKKQIEEWKSNDIKICDDDIEVMEYDDFYSTMILGESPKHTCLSYNGGGYNHCLMACFDSNKKILYAKINGKIVARAMVRLTKGTYKYIKNTNEKLTFVDIENIKPEKNTNIEKIERNEYLTIFLEKSYISGVSSKEEAKIKKMFISLLEKKAMNMNALLVLSKYYSDVVDNNYFVTNYYIYISKSKAGAQYLDSLGGENTITNEGKYSSNTFMIWQNQEEFKMAA